MFVETILVHLPTQAELAHAAGFVPPSDRAPVRQHRGVSPAVSQIETQPGIERGLIGRNPRGRQIGNAQGHRHGHRARAAEVRVLVGRRGIARTIDTGQFVHATQGQRQDAPGAGVIEVDHCAVADAQGASAQRIRRRAGQRAGLHHVGPGVGVDAGQGQRVGARLGQAASAADVAADAHSVIRAHRGIRVHGDRPHPRCTRAVGRVERAAIQGQRIGRTGVFKLQRGPAVERHGPAAQGITAVGTDPIRYRAPDQRAALDDRAAAVGVGGQTADTPGARVGERQRMPRAGDHIRDHHQPAARAPQRRGHVQVQGRVDHYRVGAVLVDLGIGPHVGREGDRVPGERHRPREIQLVGRKAAVTIAVAEVIGRRVAPRRREIEPVIRMSTTLRRGRGNPVARRAPVTRGGLVPSGRHPPAPELIARNRHVADFQTRRRRDQQGRVHVAQGSHRRRGEVSAAIRPGAVNLHHVGLELFALGRGQTGLHDRRLVGEAKPVIRHHVAILDPRLERAHRRPRIRPDGVTGHRVGHGCRRWTAAVKGHARELRRHCRG